MARSGWRTPPSRCVPVARRAVAGLESASIASRQARRAGPTGNAGFTLLEVLVVVGIIAVVAAISVLAAFQARRSARTSVCAGNARQIGMAMRMYTSDHDGVWPSTEAWLAGLPEYLGRDRGHLACPDAKPPVKNVAGPSVPGYAYSSDLTVRLIPRVGPTPTTPDALVRFPAVTVSHCDEAVGVHITTGPDPYRHVPFDRPPGEEEGWKRHAGGANYGFCDGHVKWLLPDAVGYNQLGANDGTRPSFAL